VKPRDKPSQAQSSRLRQFYARDTQQFGFLAEEVEQVNPDLVARDDEGKPYTVRYESVNAMLLNEFIKARRQIDSHQKQSESLPLKYREIIVDRLSNAGWSLGCVSAADIDRRTIWIVDAHRDGKHLPCALGRKADCVSGT
jgi:hypothetical protein